MQIDDTSSEAEPPAVGEAPPRPPHMVDDLYFDGWLEVLNPNVVWERKWVVLRYGVLVIFNRESVCCCGSSLFVC